MENLLSKAWDSLAISTHRACSFIWDLRSLLASSGKTLNYRTQLINADCASQVLTGLIFAVCIADSWCFSVHFYQLILMSMCKKYLFILILTFRWIKADSGDLWSISRDDFDYFFVVFMQDLNNFFCLYYLLQDVLSSYEADCILDKGCDGKIAYSLMLSSSAVLQIFQAGFSTLIYKRLC